MSKPIGVIQVVVAFQRAGTDKFVSYKIPDSIDRGHPIFDLKEIEDAVSGLVHSAAVCLIDHIQECGECQEESS